MKNVRWVTGAILALGACTSRDVSGPTSPELRSNASVSNSAHGAVYTMSNSEAGNSILSFNRSADGSLSTGPAYATGGLGSGGGLGSQNALILSSNERYLLAVNAGSNDVSVFAVEGDGIRLIGVTPSGGVRPVSVTLRDGIAYVLNAGGTNNIAGFSFDKQGNLASIPGSTRLLSAASTAPAQVEFSPSGRVLVVTEKATNKISTYLVGLGAVVSEAIVNNSAGATPFGFAFSQHGTLIVSEAFGGAPGASAVSSYTVGNNGVPAVKSASVTTGETAACWIVVTNSGRFAYTSNTGSGSISGFTVRPDGTLVLLTPGGLTGVTGPGTDPIDLALSRNSQYLYALNRGNGSIAGFAVGSNGSLDPIGAVAGLPASAVGLVAR